ncbi:DUF421 domain-containing protein [Clostridium paraputrificum]|uniref:DUF421 domain-containing protein n=1 Tax=Clostridium TaxID=1485 RepID=UPI003D33897D
MNNVYLMTIIKTVAVYLLSLFLSRRVGTKLISHMNFFDLIMSVSMGSIIASIIIDKDSATISGVIALILFSILTILTSYVSIKSLKLRKILNSEPVILVENGRILDMNMKKLRITINELMMKLREKHTFNLSDVEYAIMERDGKLSVLVKADSKPIAPKDMNIEVKSSGLLKDIIIDGKIIERNLEAAGVDKEWLENKLKGNKISSASDVFYAGIDKNKKLTISKRYPSDFKSENRYGIE